MLDAEYWGEPMVLLLRAFILLIIGAFAWVIVRGNWQDMKCPECGVYESDSFLSFEVHPDRSSVTLVSTGGRTYANQSWRREESFRLSERRDDSFVLMRDHSRGLKVDGLLGSVTDVKCLRISADKWRCENTRGTYLDTFHRTRLPYR